MSAHTASPAGLEAPERPRQGLALLVIAAAQLMLVLDGTIVNVALPSIGSSLEVASGNLNWMLTAYALTFGGLLLVGGRAGDLFGRRRVFRAGLVLFAGASMLGGLAPTGDVLIAARALQGAGAAIAAPTALSLLATTFPAGPARAKALGVYGAMGGLGSVVGLLLGGVLTQYLDWRWVLFVNVPIAVVVLAGTTVLVAGERDHGAIDLPGALTATLGLGSLVFAINRAQAHGWTATSALGLFAAAMLLLLVFVLVQRRSPVAMLPLEILRDRGRSGAYAVLFLVGAGMFATFFFLTLYMQVVKAYSPMRTGVAYLPFALGIGLAAGGLGPRLVARFAERTVAVTGLLLAALGMAWLSSLAPDTGYAAVLLPAQFVAGLGLGLTMVTMTVVGVRGVGPRDSGIASGLVNTSQQIGGALGLAVLAAVASAATADPARAASLVDGYAAALLAGGALYLVAVVVAAVMIGGRAGDHPASAGG